MSPTDDHLRPATSRSTTRSRPHSMHRATSSASYLTQGPDALLLPEGNVSEETVGLLHELVQRRNRSKARMRTETTLVAGDVESQVGVPPKPSIEIETEEDAEGEEDPEEKEDWEAMQRRPWYKRPTPMWVLCSMPFSAIAMSSTAAPRIEILTMLACKQHKPEYTTEIAWHNSSSSDFRPGSYHSLTSDVLNYDQNSVHENYSEYLTSSSIPSAMESVDKCAKDPVVQAAVAQLMAILTTTMGVLGCFTTAFWGSLSDRYGRLRVLGISVFGLLLTDVNFIAVYYFADILPGGYWFLLAGPVVEGCLGGLACAIAAIHAYVADCTRPEMRSRIFSRSLGLLFVGTAFGPTVGSLLIRFTHSAISVFFVATAVHIVYAFLIWFVVPESVSPRVRAINKARWKSEKEAARKEEAQAVEKAKENGQSALRVKSLYRLKDALVFLAPLKTLAPVRIQGDGKSVKTHLDWSLTLVAIAFGCATLIIGSVAYKFQYAEATFDWSSEELGYWLSMVGASRAIYLVAILPLLIKYLNRPKQSIALPVEPDEPLNGEQAGPSSSGRDDGTPHTHSGGSTKLAPHSSAFDLKLARASLALEACTFAALAIAPNAAAFCALSVLLAFGGGFGPAVQALALELYMRRQKALKRASEEENGSGDGGDGARSGEEPQGRVQEQETGRLFGALSVMQALGQQILGPALFGLTYMKTVATFPGAIFWLSFTCVSLALVCMCLVRLPPEGAGAIPLAIDVEANVVEGEENVAKVVHGATGVRPDREATLVEDV